MCEECEHRVELSGQNQEDLDVIFDLSTALVIRQPVDFVFHTHMIPAGRHMELMKRTMDYLAQDAKLKEAADRGK